MKIKTCKIMNCMHHAPNSTWQPLDGTFCFDPSYSIGLALSVNHLFHFCNSNNRKQYPKTNKTSKTTWFIFLTNIQEWMSHFPVSVRQMNRAIINNIRALRMIKHIFKEAFLSGGIYGGLRAGISCLKSG